MRAVAVPGAAAIRLMLLRSMESPATYLVGLPVLASLPQLLGILHADPMLRTSGLLMQFAGAPLAGVPVLDPNDGFTTQALGTLAARDWLHGIVPWWNPFSGVGLPLAAEYQPAVFFPLVLLQLLPNGMVLQHILLQIIAGYGCCTLLNHLRIRRPAAVAGGVLFGFNGTLVWFNHGPALPVPFLPWTLLGIDRIACGHRDGWPLLTAALSLSLLAGFPETAYLDGLLALAWAALRLLQFPPIGRTYFVFRLALALLAALAISAPQLLAFAEFLPHAFLGGHTTGFASAAIPPRGLATGVVAPYAFGPPFAFLSQWPESLFVWGNAGGYVTLALVTLAVFGLLSRGCALAWLLSVWCFLALARTFGFPPALTVLNVLPGLPEIAAFRYLAPSWELALVLLAAFGLEELYKRGTAIPTKSLWCTSFAIAVLWLIAAALVIAAGIPVRVPALRWWAGGSLLWSASTALVILLLLGRGRAVWAGGIVAGEAVLFAILAGLSNPTHSAWDKGAVRFLKANLGLDRFYTLGPLEPNYGAYFAIASINHNYLPVARRWSDWVTSNLDPLADPIIFNGVARRDGGEPRAAEEFSRHLVEFEGLGVKYALARRSTSIHTVPQILPAYVDPVVAIYRLPNPAPYFEVVAGRCDAPIFSLRTNASVVCRTPGVLLRRELFFPGWAATVDGVPASISNYGQLFQSVELKPGLNVVRFAYAPPGAWLAWLAMATGLGLLSIGIWRCRRRGTPEFQRQACEMG